MSLRRRLEMKANPVPLYDVFLVRLLCMNYEVDILDLYRCLVASINIIPCDITVSLA